MNQIACGLVPLLAVTLCGCGDSAGPPDQGDHHADMVIESIPFDVIGQSRIAFHRLSNSPPGSSGMVILDGRTRTATKHPTHGVFAIAVSPDGTRVAYLTPTARTDKLELDVGISDLDAEVGVELGQVESSRYYPSWTPDGASVVYTESDGTVLDRQARVVLQAASPGSTRHILWQTSAPCESAPAPRANAAGDLVFIFIDANCVEHLGLKKAGQQTEILFGNGPSIFTPVWSPTGAEIAFFGLESYGRTSFVADLIIANADGSNLRNLGGITSPASLCWGADGSKLFFAAGDVPGEVHIYAMSASGGTPTAITTQAGAIDNELSCLH